ncbi:MAG: glycosyltransferase [Planctomycetota bacterium]|jgi:glycosyltransferase involved in cell wall biosynthesis
MGTTWIPRVRSPYPKTFMKIDLLITELEPGGAERCCVALAHFTQQQNHSVRVISLGRRPGPGKDLLVRQLESQDIPLHFLDATPRTLPWIVRRRLLALLAIEVPDMAQGFLWHANWIGASAYRARSVPFVAGVRVTEPRRWRAWLSGSWIRKSRKIVCVSHDVARWCQHVEGAPAEKLVVIPNGIDPIDFDQPSSDPRSSPRDRVLLFVGRLTPQKGIDGLMRCAARLLEALPGHRLVILGDGPLMESVKKDRDASPWADRISLLGRVDNVSAWMRHSEILLHPARYEGMPNAVLEAMAHGMAVVAFRVEGIQELLGDGIAEQSVVHEDWEGWLALALGIGRDDALRNRLGLANRSRAETVFRLQDQLAKYLEVWSATIPAGR